MDNPWTETTTMPSHPQGSSGTGSPREGSPREGNPREGNPSEGNPSGEVGEAGDADSEAHAAAVDAVDALLDQVEMALARLDQGTYGSCQACGSPIEDDVLGSDPTVQTCGCDGSSDTLTD